MSETAETIKNLQWVAEYWPDLVDARIPGTRRPERTLTLSGQAKRERDQQAAIERAERNPLALGASPAPLDINITTLICDLLGKAEELATLIAETAGIPAPPPLQDSLDARPHLKFAATHLPQAATLDPGITRHAAKAARMMHDRVADTLGMIHDGQTLDITCPWCHGRTPETPMGGARTWRVRILPGGMIAVVCEGLCDPPAHDVGTWWYGMPVWPLERWDWLARRVRAAEESEKTAS